MPPLPRLARTVTVTVTVAVAAAGSLAGCDRPCDGVVRTLRAVTINLRHDVDRPEARLPLIADELVRLDPDFVGLQEIEIAVGQAEALLELVAARQPPGAAPYHLYQELKIGPFGILSGEGVGILSRFPLEETGFVDLVEGGRVTVFGRARVDDCLAVDVYNTHLESGGGDEVRRPQAELTVAFMDERTTGQVEILTGDMNATPESGTIATFAAAGLRDTYREHHGAAAEETGNTSPIVLAEGAFEQHPTRRIDYVFVRAARFGAARVVDSEVAFRNHAPCGLYPSDHLGVVTTLAVRVD